MASLLAAAFLFAFSPLVSVTANAPDSDPAAPNASTPNGSAPNSPAPSSPIVSMEDAASHSQDAFADSLQQAYAAQDPETVHALLDAADSRTETWMARYRLYPLTEDEEVLGDPPSQPEDVPDATATELALWSGIWAYKAGETNIFNAMRYGRRSVNFLEAAREADEDDPYVLLVEGQSLLFRPSMAGKDVAGAIDTFRALRVVLNRHRVPGISKTEAQTWLWLALKEGGHHDEATSLHKDLLATDPAPLYRQFLEDPPKV
jgi:hypothetical protein